MKVTFLGVRGSLPRAHENFLYYGGDTSCVSVTFDKTLVIFDAGTGIYNLNDTVNAYESIYIFLSHLHIDHIVGLPFFKPLWLTEKKIHLFAANTKPYGGLKTCLNNIFTSPFFPVQFDDFSKTNICHDLTYGQEEKFPNFSLQTHSLTHPGGATGYRLTHQNKSVCYMTDHEHNEKNNLVPFIQNTDLFIYDASYDDTNFEKHKGWGHSTWQKAITFGEAANVKRTALFHHDLVTTDNTLKAREKEITSPHVFIARQGMRLDL